VKKETLVKQVAADRNITVVEAGRTIDSFLDAIAIALENHEDVVIQNFCTIKVKLRAARQARNMVTGAIIEVPSTYAATARFSQRFRRIAPKL